ncbi:MAG: MFS transporter [Staphylococcus hominis]|nr:MAG: MFS transporter [Staphylococcus hominis]
MGYASTYITAGIIGFVGFGLCLRIPKIKVTLASDTEEEPNLIRVPTWKLVLVPALALTTFSMSYGAVSSFLPPAVQELDAERGASLAGFMLSIVGGAAMIFRYFAGMVADRVSWACSPSPSRCTSTVPCGGSCWVPSSSVVPSVLRKMRPCCRCLTACRASASRRLRPSGISSMTAEPAWARPSWAPWSPATAMQGLLGPAWSSSSPAL